MKGTKRSKSYSSGPVSSYFSLPLQLANSKQALAAATTAEESHANVNESGSVLGHGAGPCRTAAR